MKIPFKPVALGAAVVPRMGKRAFTNDSTSQVIMASTGQIQVADFDGSSFKATLKATVDGAPTWVEFVEPNKLYAVDENGSDLRLYNLDLSGPKLSDQPIATGTGSSGVVHLEFNKDKTRLVGAGYGAGSIDIWNIENDQLTLIKTIASEGELGPVKPNQEAAHPHQANLDPSGRYFAVNDLGTDEILLIDSADDAWELGTPAKAPEGCGPRHGVFYPQGDDVTEATHYMVNCELSNQVIVYKLTYGENELSFEQTQAVSSFVDTAPEGAAGGEIALSSDNKNLYVSNRLTGGDSDNITRFQVQEDGTIKAVDSVSSGGQLPRMFSLGSQGEIFIGNQNGPNAAVALSTQEDGSIKEEPTATLPLSDFGGEGFGPAYIKQL